MQANMLKGGDHLSSAGCNLDTDAITSEVLLQDNRRVPENTFALVQQICSVIGVLNIQLRTHVSLQFRHTPAWFDDDWELLERRDCFQFLYCADQATLGHGYALCERKRKSFVLVDDGGKCLIIRYCQPAVPFKLTAMLGER